MKRQQIAAQLYTCRGTLKTEPEIEQTLKRVREIGYEAVQVSGVGPIDVKRLKDLLDAAGLVCCATHEPTNTIIDEPYKVIERLAILGCRHTAVPFPNDRDLSKPEVVSKFVKDLNRAGAALAEAGIVLSYHNHHHEFQKCDGRRVFDWLVEETEPGNLSFELDTYWAQYGGMDVVAMIERLNGRIPVMHLKDYRITPEPKPDFAEVGSGNLDFPKILRAADASGCQWYAVEQDTCPGDPLDSLAQSFRYLASLAS